MYQLTKLDYSYQELEPFIDTHTMGLHYHKHATNYLNKLNNLLIKNNYTFNYTLMELIYHINEFPKNDQENILFNLGGVLNHNLYFKSMNPKNKNPEGNLKIAIDNKYGSLEKFWNSFKEKALLLKGSGYTFFVLKNNGDLDIINLSNQEMPITLGYIPLFNVDMWEHAYYLNYKNEKEKYLDNFFEVADFSYADKLYNSIIKQK